MCALTEKLPPACQPLHKGRWVYEREAEEPGTAVSEHQQCSETQSQQQQRIFGAPKGVTECAELAELIWSQRSQRIFGLPERHD